VGAGIVCRRLYQIKYYKQNNNKLLEKIINVVDTQMNQQAQKQILKQINLLAFVCDWSFSQDLRTSNDYYKESSKNSVILYSIYFLLGELKGRHKFIVVLIIKIYYCNLYCNLSKINNILLYTKNFMRKIM